MKIVRTIRVFAQRLRLTLEGLVRRAARRLGIHVAWAPKIQNGWMIGAVQTFPTKLYVGSGPDSREGYINCDVRPVAGVDLVCPAWHVSKFATGLESIYTRHALEHLTDMEARAALEDWHSSLKLGGTVEIIVPDLRFHLDQWLRVKWNEEGKPFTKTEGRWAFAGLFGWQHECDPALNDYNNTYWDVHKSGYDFERLKYLLEAAGFAEVMRIDAPPEHLHVTASKLTLKDERQVAPTLAGIRGDHRARYELAVSLLKPGDMVGDFACGVGYGSYMLAVSDQAPRVVAADIDEGAIKYAQAFYEHPRIEYRIGDAAKIQLPQNTFDLITCFETLEHVKPVNSLLGNLSRALKPNGWLLVSTPNEDVLPFRDFHNPYHVRHYTPMDFEELLVSCGFDVERRLTQVDRVPGVIQDGWHGMYNVAVCRKRATS